MKKRKRSWGKLLGQLTLILCAVAALFPVLFMVTHSFFSGSEITESYGALSEAGRCVFTSFPTGQRWNPGRRCFSFPPPIS